VIAAGSIGDGTGAIRLAVRAYDAKTGSLLWHDLVDKGGGFDMAASVALSGGHAFVAGIGGAACRAFVVSDCDWLIRAYDQSTGALLWERQVDRAGGDDQALFVAAHGDRVLVAGVTSPAFGALEADWLVQVYGAATGALVWEDVVPAPAGGFAFANHLAVSGSRAFVTGVIVDGSGNQDWVVRAHKLREGRRPAHPLRQR
jgi:outer membrane protein assembly factor BamB